MRAGCLRMIQSQVTSDQPCHQQGCAGEKDEGGAELPPTRDSLLKSRSGTRLIAVAETTLAQTERQKTTTLPDFPGPNLS